MTIIERINELADHKGLQRKALCEASGATYGQISTWTKANVSSIPSEYVEPLANLLGVSSHYLLTGELDIPMTDDGRRLIDLFNNLDWEGRHMVMATAINEKRRLEQDKD